MANRIYLDHAATTPMTPAARAAMLEGMARWANPSSPHAEGRAARAALEEARAAVAAAHGWTGEVLLTSGASESLGLAIGRSTLPAVAISAVEHDAAIRAAGDGAHVIRVGADGLVDPDSITSLPAGTLVCVQWSNSETGVRQPIARIAEAAHAAGCRLLVDAAQMPAGVDAELAEHADLVALSAHKRGGPPGVGALLVRDLSLIRPSGGQERGYRPGTENLPGALAYAAALAEAEPIGDWAGLRARLDDAIVRSGGEVVAAGSPRHPAVGSYRLAGTPSAAQLIRLDLAGIAVSAGSACASGSLKPSHVLAAMGYAPDAAKEVIRVSFGRTTTQAEVDAFIAAWRTMARATNRFAA
ncbi:cysteine desulfurase [Sphingomonas gellani]|uniref:Cysteine desulfurase n=1 Tax=Sphingomonas gellani TaxID=1166340 RepID=A0A1H7YCH8_9SPHN|nr:aminotransferase class V-fold PLP-dependent enzyme [Sphingomonas gellani]SEM43601.1 cysteine desulfurase [Sphingomonas gellani]